MATRSAPSRAIWSGTISFGLVGIQVKLHAAEERSEQIHFHQLDKHDHARIRYERLNSETGKPVDYKDIVKGFEIARDKYVVLDAADLAKANVKATKTIDIQDFVPAAEIDPLYFETPYWAVPDPKSAKAYALLRAALEKKKAVAIATFVMRTREHLVALMPVGDGIMLETLRFGHEVRAAEDVGIEHSRGEGFAPREVSMAEELVDRMTVEFDPKKYKDRYHDDVAKIAAEKAKTGTVTAHHVPEEAAPREMVDLLDLLKKSVAANGPHAKPGPKKAKPRGRRARAA